MTRHGTPAGGKYTRPRRGYRTKSKYRQRLKRRGLTPADVRYEPLLVIRTRQLRIGKAIQEAYGNGQADET